jgi:hypothetical protein
MLDTKYYDLIEYIHLDLDQNSYLGFWTWYSKKLENTELRKLDLFPSSGEKVGTCSVDSPIQS